MKRENGSIPLIMAISIALTVGGFVATVLTVTSSEVFKARQESYRIRSEMIADLALEEGVAWVKDSQRLAALDHPWAAFDALSTTTWTEVATDAAVMSEGNRVGTYSVAVRLRLGTGGDPFVRDVEILATGRYDVGDGDLAYKDGGVQRRMMARAELSPSKVFDYAYFINNWGWFYGNSIYNYGNVRSNAQFDAGGYSPTIDGRPRFDHIVRNGDGSFSLQGYQDDGGVFSGWDIVGVQNVQGMGGLAQNQYSFQEQVAMPNLTDLGLYEGLAATHSSSVTVSDGLATPVKIDRIFGDDPGESGNLYLRGTAANPIVIDGPFVVRGNLYIEGYVSGQGAIYAGGNIYVGDDIIYADPPTTARPASNSQADIEAWITANKSKDTLGLYARENIVVGDASSSEFQSHVGSWLAEAHNESREDAGIDGVPNTRKGRDGISGTEDDDTLEGDGVWTVDRYTAEQQALGMIPAGKNVGDVIPGSGEDIDGDGVFDDTTTIADLEMSSGLWNMAWGGNKTAGLSYADDATNDIARLDAAFYTNHALGARVINSGGTIEWNGSIVSRNEAIVYSANRCEINHDARLYGGGNMFGFYVPVDWAEIEVWPVNFFEPRP